MDTSVDRRRSEPRSVPFADTPQLGLQFVPVAVEVAERRSEPYLPRAETYLRVGKRREAIAALDIGLRMTPDSQELLSAREALGWRGARVIPALPRAHIINRVVGRLRSLARRPFRS